MAYKLEYPSEKVGSDLEDIRVAYALNMCTVSVSQIIDYNDLNILEQEYEGILNNLNIEMMPDDDELLSILKHLMETITFFRIQEGDKKIVESEYRQKMKNAIWNAVPNFGLIVSGGNPITMAVSLASQVGIGYMNYRRAKIDISIEEEKAKWQLQRAAIEQFHVLRRELFDTAWRLTKKHKFNDKYRLTEKQISQYNLILSDADIIRRYERLYSIHKYFYAYPPFWYQIGSTANEIYRSDVLGLDENVRQKYKNLAKEHFEQYRKSNTFELLRVNEITSACCLEYIDLLDANADRNKILELLNEAVEVSGDANDVLQLCVFAYMKVGETKEVKELLRRLINEDYNKVVNGQLLSRLYVDEYIKNKSADALFGYKILTKRVNPSYLFEWPDEGKTWEEIQHNFHEEQKKVLIEKYFIVISEFLKEYCIRFNSIVPIWRGKAEITRECYTDSSVAVTFRVQQAKIALKSHKNEYLSELDEVMFGIEYLNLFEEMLGKLEKIECIGDIHKLADFISDHFVLQRDKITILQRKIAEYDFTLEDYKEIEEMTFLSFCGEAIEQMLRNMVSTICQTTETNKLNILESHLRDLCIQENIAEPEIMFERREYYQKEYEEQERLLPFELLEKDIAELERQRAYQNSIIELEKMVRESENLVQNTDKGKTNVYLRSSLEFKSYFNQKAFRNSQAYYNRKAFAIVDDRSRMDYDLIFTIDGIIPMVKGSLKNKVSYKDLVIDGHKKEILIPGCSMYSNKDINMTVMNCLVEKIKSFVDNATSDETVHSRQLSVLLDFFYGKYVVTSKGKKEAEHFLVANTNEKNVDIDYHQASKIVVDERYEMPNLGTVIQGKVLYGIIHENDRVAVFRNDKKILTAVAKAIEVNNMRTYEAKDGDLAGVLLYGVSVDTLKKGDVVRVIL